MAEEDARRALASSRAVAYQRHRLLWNRFAVLHTRLLEEHLNFCPICESEPSHQIETFPFLYLVIGPSLLFKRP